MTYLYFNWKSVPFVPFPHLPTLLLPVNSLPYFLSLCCPQACAVSSTMAGARLPFCSASTGPSAAPGSRHVFDWPSSSARTVHSGSKSHCTSPLRHPSDCLPPFCCQPQHPALWQQGPRGLFTSAGSLLSLWRLSSPRHLGRMAPPSCSDTKGKSVGQESGGLRWAV